MNRLEYLEELSQEAKYNLNCYSKDSSMTEPREEYKTQWNCEQEKIEILQELIEENRNSRFQLYTSMYNLRNEIENRKGIVLACIADREKGISCYLTFDYFHEKDKPQYILVLSIHDKKAFDEKYEKICTATISKDSFSNIDKLKEKMENEIDMLECFIEADKKNYRVFSKYYEDDKQNKVENEETDEIE